MAAQNSDLPSHTGSQTQQAQQERSKPHTCSLLMTTFKTGSTKSDYAQPTHMCGPHCFHTRWRCPSRGQLCSSHTHVLPTLVPHLMEMPLTGSTMPMAALCTGLMDRSAALISHTCGDQMCGCIKPQVWWYWWRVDVPQMCDAYPTWAC